MDIDIGLVFTLIVTVLVAVIPILLNEYWKRRTALTERLWELDRYSL